MPRKPAPAPTATIVRRSSDASLDYDIPRDRAKSLHAEGKLTFSPDLPGKYCDARIWDSFDVPLLSKLS